LKKFHITFPIILDFNYPKEGSKYGIALVDSDTFAKYNLIIHYNPRLITSDFNQLVITGLHEYAHFIYRQKDYFSHDYYAQLFPNINHIKFTESIEQLTNELVQKNILKIPHEHKVLLENKCVIEDCFAEGFAEFFLNSNEEIIVQEKKSFETILDIHIEIMKKIRRVKFSEYYDV
jgi:hypothetical protein